MEWTELHTRILGRAFKKVLGKPEGGTMAFVRCLTPEVVQKLAKDPSFEPEGWQVLCIADSDDEERRTISADRAVEIRETKRDATLLLVDTEQAGAGMDGIYSAAREVDEASLFAEALRLAKGTIGNDLFSKHQPYAKRAVKKARGYGYGRHLSVSLWTEFDFLCRIATDKSHPGAYLHLLGLWPVEESEGVEAEDALKDSRLFVDRLLGLGIEAGGLTPARRIASLRLLRPSERQVNDLERFLHSAATKPLLDALAELRDKKHLWVGALKTEGSTRAIRSIALSPWRNRTGKIAKWSGLVEKGDSPPAFIMKPDADKTGDYSKLEIKWKARPENLEKDAVEYRVVITTGMNEEVAYRDIPHSAGKEEKCRFSNDDFPTLSEEGGPITAKVVVSVLDNGLIEPQESEEFTICFGQLPEHDSAGAGKKVRTFSEGLIELEDRDVVSALPLDDLPVDSKDFVLLRTPQRGKSFRVFRPSLIGEVEKQWNKRKEELGRWRIKVRDYGTRAGECEFVPFARPESASGDLWDRAVSVSRRMAERFASCSGVGQVYDEKARTFGTVKEYLLAWADLLEKSTPSLALAHTVEVQSLSGGTIGLIVLPSHPLRVAWQVAYDNLVLHAAFAQKMPPRDIRDEFAGLDGALFPAFLPGLHNGQSFVFADTLGFHALGMVPDDDKEPKAAVAILARALGESDTADTAPTVGRQSATVLGNEIGKYLDCHNASGPLQIHALRAGDGLTVARSLGRVHERNRSTPDDEDSDEATQETAPAFVLELYPSQERRWIAGRFIAETQEKRRKGAGVLSPDDFWMLESLSFPGGVTLPKLRWARKDRQPPKTAAHLAIAFDTFESRVMPQGPLPKSRPLYAFGLLSFFERAYASTPSPLWHSAIPASKDGEKHPSDPVHTDRLMRLQQAVQKALTRNIGSPDNLPVLTTEITPDKADSLRDLHRRCDWVITLDRNAGIEYFDSPRDNKEIYDAYVIDCVPEREDLGCLQLITSTSNQEEIRSLLDGALDQMGLSRSRRNAAFLMEHLKALSGRLAIRLTGDKAPTSELIALAVCHANCSQPSEHDDCWVSLRDGFIIPVDDIRDLLPPLNRQEGNEEEKESRPDLIYVSIAPRRGLRFQFIEVKYRRHLRTARTPELLSGIRQQVESLRKRWDEWYGHKEVCPSFRAIRRATLARVLRFYADKAHRHGLSNERHEALVSEIDRMIEKGESYAFAEVGGSDCGWVFCPEYTGHSPLDISPAGTGWNTQIFLVGSGLLPDADFHRDSVAHPSDDSEQRIAGRSGPPEHEDQGPGGGPDAPVRVASDPGDTSAEKLHSSDETPSVCLGTDIFTHDEVRWPLTVQGNPHLLVAGLPGMGKTTCLLNLCKQMLAAGIRPIVFSYHQDIDERLEHLVESVRFIDFHGLGFNPLQVLGQESRLAYLDVAGALRDIFMAIFPELGDIQGERIRKAVKDSFVEAGWDDPDTAPADRREPEFKRFMEILQSDPKPDKGLRTLRLRLEELEDYGFFDIQASHESLWESERPVLIRIHTTQNDNLQKAFASLVFYGLYKDMFRRGIQDRITHAVIFDEAHRASGLKLIPTMAKECRKYGISLVLASQEARDFDISLFSAIANYLVLRLTETDAKALVRNVASSQQERSLIDKIKQMARFKALYFCEGESRPSPLGLLP